MKYYVAILDMLDPARNQELRPAHLDYLQQIEAKGNIFAKGPFEDGSGGMVIYLANSYEEAKELAEQDPYVLEGVRQLQLREWKKAD